jgi:hypothetical protein
MLLDEPTDHLYIVSAHANAYNLSQNLKNTYWSREPD